MCSLDLPRPRKRLTELMLKAVKEAGGDKAHKSWGFRFFRSPVEVLAGADGKRATGIRLALNELEVNVQNRIRTMAASEIEYFPTLW